MTATRQFEVIVSRAVSYPKMEGTDALRLMNRLNGRGIQAADLEAYTYAIEIGEFVTLDQMQEIYGDWL